MPTNFQQKLLEEVKTFIEPLTVAASNAEAFDRFFRAIGWDLDQIPGAIGGLQAKLSIINSAYTTFDTLIQSPIDTLEDFTDALNCVESLIDAVQKLKLATGVATFDGFDKIGNDLIEYLTASYLEETLPKFFELLNLLGLVDHVLEQDDSEFTLDSVYPYDLIRYPYKSNKLKFNKISQLLSNSNYFQQEYFLPVGPNWIWATTNATANLAAPGAKDTAQKLFPRFARFLNTLGVRTMVGFDPTNGLNLGPVNQTLSEVSMLVFLTPEGAAAEAGLIFTLSAVDQGGLGVVITPFGSLSYSVTTKDWQIDSSISGTIPSFAVSKSGFQFPTSFTAGRVGGNIDIIKIPPSTGSPAVLIGSSTGTHIQIGEFSVGGDFELSSELREFGFWVNLKDAAFLLSPGDGDGFLQKILPANGLQGEFDLKLMWDNIAGFHFEGSGSMEMLIPMHKTILNALTIDSMLVAAKIDTQIKLITAISGNLELGPFKAVFDEVGLAFDFDFPANKDGNLGALNVAVGFKPPKGLGLSMKGETVKGGGFLSFDKDEGRYVGALELSIKDRISIKVVGILTTKLPGGQAGYSLLLLITAEFQPIQLGFGFTLNGVGGLIALHRRMNTQGLRDGVRNGTIDNILFPTDPVANINSIISSLETVFPIAEGRYSFGPMAIIGWGTPTIITAELGLFFEMPNPQELALIGVIRALLPDKDSETLKLQIAFAGIINFEKKYITFDASLFDSSLLGMTLSGDMAFRLKWGSQSVFVLTVGGFHPKFTIPQLDLPTMRRLSINLCSGNNPRLTLSTYFAVTSNTAQFGSQVDFLWEVSGNLKVSGYLGFDALFYFSPFRFTATIQGGLDVKYRNKGIASMSFIGTIEGPTPWHLSGSVTFKLLGVKETVNFDKTFGVQKLTTLTDISVLPMLVDALKDKKNWQATMSTSVPLLVTVRDFVPTSPDDVVIHPQGTIAVSQKVVPLDLTIDRFGNRRPDPLGFKRFSIGINYNTTISTADPILPKTDLKESFAPNEFFDLSEDQRLSRPSFEQMTSGIQVSNTSNALTSGNYHEIQQDYELIYMDSRYKPVKMSTMENIPFDAMIAFTGNGSAANSPLGTMAQGRSSAGPSNINLSGNQYVIAQTYDLLAYTNSSTNSSYTAGSKTEALVMMNELIENNPELEGKLNVIHKFELA